MPVRKRHRLGCLKSMCPDSISKTLQMRYGMRGSAAPINAAEGGSIVCGAGPARAGPACCRTSWWTRWQYRQPRAMQTSAAHCIRACVGGVPSGISSTSAGSTRSPAPTREARQHVLDLREVLLVLHDELHLVLGVAGEQRAGAPGGSGGAPRADSASPPRSGFGAARERRLGR